jgi:hypothetical protein
VPLPPVRDPLQVRLQLHAYTIDHQIDRNHFGASELVSIGRKD